MVLPLLWQSQAEWVLPRNDNESLIKGNDAKLKE
jgi:hypothetical protein